MSKSENIYKERRVKTFLALCSRTLCFALLTLAVVACNSRSTEPSLLIAPLLGDQNFCREALSETHIHDNETAAQFCTSKGKSGAPLISAALDEIGPKVSRSGKYQLGYTLILPMMRYFKKVKGEWILDIETLKLNLSTITDVDRPVVVYLSANHFTDAGVKLSEELAHDTRNLMRSRTGPLVPDNYYGNPVIPWTLTDQGAPINVMRRQVVTAAVNALCSLPEDSKKKIMAVSVLGEVHDLFPNFTNGPSFKIPSYSGTDYSPMAIRGFRIWLAQKYGQISKLNHDLAANYASFEVINPPSKDIHNEALKTFFEHNDIYAAGNIPVFGWINDVKGRKLKVSVNLDGHPLGVAQTGLSRTEVTDFVPSIKDPNVGFRLNFDYRNIAYGVHTLEVFVSIKESEPLLLAKRKLVLINRNQDAAPEIHYEPTNTKVKLLSSDPDLSGYLDGPADLASALYNPMAQLWLEYRNQVVRNYLEHFASIVGKSCIPKEKIFSHQITPMLGTWNSDLLASDASKQLSQWYNPGTTLYGGAVYGKEFLEMKKELGWKNYAVSEAHPVVKLDANQYLSMFEMHRKNGAVFFAPYYVPVRHNLNSEGNLDSLSISPGNLKHGSDLFYKSIVDVMKQ